MGSLMDLVAGDARDILLALTVDDVAGLDDPDRFRAHLALGGGLDPTWLDLFSEAVRSVTGGEGPTDFLDARSDLEGMSDALERIVLGAERRIMLSHAERERTAYHESGHALLALLVPGSDPVHRISIVPRGMALGATQQLPVDDRTTH